MSGEEELVSVIIPVFNREKSIKSAIQSVLKQDYQNIELIVVDDCSTDSTCAEVQQIDDARIKLVHSPVNGGAAAARNFGLSHAKADLIAFQDSDDLWLPGKLRRQVDLLATLPPDVGVLYGGKIIYGKESYIRGQRNKVDYSPPLKTGNAAFSPVFDELITTNRLTIQTALFRLHSIPSGLHFDESLGFDEDWEIAVRLSIDTKMIELPEPLVLAFISENSISQSIQSRFSMAVLQIQRKHRDKLANMPAQSAELRYRLGKSLDESGKSGPGRKFILQACCMRPWMIKWWTKYLVLRLKALQP